MGFTGGKTTRALACAFMTWAALCVAAAPVRAQSSEAERTAMARSLFEEARTHAQMQQWEQAADRLQRAVALRESAVLAYNLGVALSHLGRLVEATEWLRQVARDADARAHLRSQSQELIDELAPRLGHLTVSLSGSTDDVVVLLDDRALERVMWGMATPVDPGAHVVAVRRGDRVLQRREVSVAPAERQVVELQVEVAEKAPARMAPTPAQTAQAATPAPAPLPAPADRPRRTGLWVGVAAGAAAVVVGSTLALLLSGGGSTTAGEPVDSKLGVIHVGVDP